MKNLQLKIKGQLQSNKKKQSTIGFNNTFTCLPPLTGKGEEPKLSQRNRSLATANLKMQNSLASRGSSAEQTENSLDSVRIINDATLRQSDLNYI
jgi:hypothetical protein